MAKLAPWAIQTIPLLKKLSTLLRPVVIGHITFRLNFALSMRKGAFLSVPTAAAGKELAGFCLVLVEEILFLRLGASCASWEEGWLFWCKVLLIVEEPGHLFVYRRQSANVADSKKWETIADTHETRTANGSRLTISTLHQ
jgi:hypothetical protein